MSTDISANDYWTIEIPKPKKFWHDHKEAIVVGACTFGLGILVGIVSYSDDENSIESEGDNCNILQVNGHDNVINYNELLSRRGHPGNAVKCEETGEIFASQNRAAEANNISPTTLRRNLIGEIPDAKGLHFTKLGEMP